jgi:signal transduction histidine kinase
MLDSALLKAGKFKKNESEFNISKTVQKVIDMQKTEANEKGISLCYENLTFDDALLINTDEQRVMQVLFSL